MKKLTAFLIVVPCLVFAGKEEREYMKGTVMPAVTEAQSAFKKSCGCDLKITVDEATIKTTDDMYQVKHVVESVKDGVGGYCTDAESKKAVCQLKSLKIVKAKETKFSFAGGAGTASTDGQSYTSFEMLTQELDK